MQSSPTVTREMSNLQNEIALPKGISPEYAALEKEKMQLELDQLSESLETLEKQRES